MIKEMIIYIVNNISVCVCVYNFLYYITNT